MAFGLNGQLAQRWRLAAVGAVGGVALWAAIEVADRGLLGDLPAFILVVAIAVCLGATLVMAGPVGLGRAAPRALGLAAAVALLLWTYLQRHETVDGLFSSPLPVLALILVAMLPIPFMIAQARGNWRDYGALFLEAWSIVVRSFAAWVFTGVVWLVIFLSDQVLKIVGISVISDLLEHWSVPMVLTGAVLGLGMAVVYELADLLSPYLVLRLFRLLLPAVLAVMVIFVIALPFRGLGGLFSGLSPALLLLTMAGAGIALVATAVDQSDADAAQSRTILRAAQAMSLILPVMSGLAAWAVWQRVAQYGWTPDRLFVALVAGLGLAYGILYAGAVLRGMGWMVRIRNANVGMALVVILLSALWLTPLLNAERLSAQSQLARFESGATSVADLDVAALGRWGKPGEAVLAVLTERSLQPGQEALAARLAGEAPGTDPGEKTAALETLTRVLPVQPATATGTRDTLLAAAESYTLVGWADTCGKTLPDGRAPCLLVVADLLPGFPGEEAILMVDHGQSYVELQGLYPSPDGSLAIRTVVQADGRFPSPEAARDMMDAWTSAPPPLTPARINQIGTGDTGLIIQP